MPLSKQLVWVLALLMSIPPVAPAQGRRPAPRRDALAGVIEELLKSPITAEEWRGLNPGDEDTSSTKPGKEAEEKAPADDAPIADLIAFWTQHNYGDGPKAPKPSDRVRERLLEACEDRPQNLFMLMNLLPDTQDAHDRVYKIYEAEPDNQRNLKEMLRMWLKQNTRYFRDELVADASEGERPAPYQGGELEALARLDWEAARPLLERASASSEFYRSGVALGLLYEKAVEAGDAAAAEALRARLKAFVIDPSIDPNARSRGLVSLMNSEWDGQREWLLGLFSNRAVNGIAPKEEPDSPGSRGYRAQSGPLPPKVGPSMAFREGNESLLAPILQQAPEKWLPVVGSLIGGDRTVHLAAVKALALFLGMESGEIETRKEIARKLLPWLTDPSWAGPEERNGYIYSLVDLKMAEALAGAIWILEHDEDAMVRATAGNLAARLGDARAAPALRQALDREKDESNRAVFINAIAKCRGFSDEELAAGIEAYARMKATESGAEKLARARWDEGRLTLPIGVSIGRAIDEDHEVEFTEGLAIRLIERARQLRATQPAVAREILAIIQDEPLPIVRADLIERIGQSRVDLNGVRLALANRDDMLARLDSELLALEKQGGYAAGLAVVILKDERRQRDVLRGEDARAQIALLAAARFMNDKLPVETVGGLLQSADRALTAAAEGYLEFEDSPEARRMIYARHRGQARILGERIRRDYQPELPEGASPSEDLLRREILEQKGLDIIYAVMPANGYGHNGTVVRVRSGRAEISLYSTEGRRQVRWLTDAEFGELMSFTSRQEVEDLPAESKSLRPRFGPHGEVNFEYLRLTRDGGRRILLSDFQAAPRRNPTLHEELAGLFHRFTRSGEYRTRYAIEEKIPGVEVLLADRGLVVERVCREGQELRVLAHEKLQEEERRPRMRRIRRVEGQWRALTDGQLGSVVEAPRACRPFDPEELGTDGDNEIFAGPPSRVGDMLIYAVAGKAPAVWISRPGADPVKVADQWFNFSIVTPDARWLVGVQFDPRGEPPVPQLVRLDLKTGREFKIELESAPFQTAPIAWLEAHGKILLGPRFAPEGMNANGSYSLLDPESGALTAVRGEFRPLLHQTARALQPTGAPHEFWAALRDQKKNATLVGRYDARRFAFTPVLELPELPIDSSEIWVDADAGRLWITYRGDLLRVPLPAK